MAFDNVKAILKVGSLLSSYKLLLLQGALSRPKYSSLFRVLLRPFVSDGCVAVRYRCHKRMLISFVRTSEMESDFYSIRELGVADVYSLDLTFHPDLVLDGGGNIGMFTLLAATGLESAGDTKVKYVVCEPVPANLKQISAHLAVNGLKAEILPVCIGGFQRTIPFYCREANQGSFEPDKPYQSVIDMPVITLNDAIGAEPVERILIKLDIEGMEVEALSTFIPSERRAVYLVGELHSVPLNAPLMQKLFRENGWALELFGIANDTCTFRGCSPAAIPLLASMADPARIDLSARPDDQSLKGPR